MNILLISHDLSVTGAPNSLLRQAKYFRDAGHSVDVLSLGNGPLQDRYIEAGFCPKIIKNKFADIKRAWKHREHDYDFIISNTTETYKAVDFLQRQNVPMVWFIRETKLVNDRSYKRPGFWQLFSKFYNIYTVSDYAADICRKYNPSVRVINNAIADNFKKFKKPGKKIVFGYIGSIIPIKGIDVLLQSFTKLAKRNKNIELHITGNKETSFGKELQKYNIPQIKWLGELQGKDKEKFFNSIDVLVVPSIDDPCPLTVIEAAMYGKPIITTDTVGSNYIVNKGQNGFIVKTSSVSDLYTSMSKITKMNLHDMGKQSRKMYLRYGTPDTERTAVLKMLNDNKDNYPKVKTKPLPTNKFYLFRKESYPNGRREFYLCRLKVFTYQSQQKSSISRNQN